MPWVKYPFHVRHDGVDYSPGEVIEVDEAAVHVLRGATEEIREAVAESAAQPKRKPRSK